VSRFVDSHAPEEYVANLEQQVKQFEEDTEWRHRWHRRLGREDTETEGHFYERLERDLSYSDAVIKRFQDEQSH